jgi:GntR family transcriptional regulator
MVNETAQKDLFLRRYEPPMIRGLPKYAQLRESFIAAIEDGFFEAGQKLPTEAELARTSPFSLGTVQKAYKALVDDGVVIRRQGHGTFVTANRSQMDTPWHCRFVGNEDETFLPVYPRVVLRQPVAENGPWTTVLGRNGAAILVIGRVIGIGGEFSVYSRYFANAEKFHGLLEKTDQELERTNFKTVLRREYNLPITHVNHIACVGVFPDSVCGAIDVPLETSGLKLEIVANSGRRNPVYFQEIYVPPTDRKLYISDSSGLPDF